MSADQIGNDAKGRQGDDVDFGVAEEPEQVLEQERAATAIFRLLAHLDECGHEETGSQRAVKQHHHRGNEQRRESEERHDGGREDAPHGQRQTHQRHAARARLQCRHHIIQPTHGEADDEKDQGDKHQDDAPVLPAGRAGENRLRWVQGPAGAGGPARCEKARGQHQNGEQINPIAQHVHIGENHVPGADHQRDKVVAEASKEQSCEQEDHHDHAVHGDELEVLVRVDERKRSGKSQLQSHHPRQHQGHEPNCRRCQRVLDGDDFGVLRKDISGPPAFGMIELNIGDFGRRNVCDCFIRDIDHRNTSSVVSTGGDELVLHAQSFFDRHSPTHRRICTPPSSGRFDLTIQQTSSVAPARRDIHPLLRR